MYNNKHKLYDIASRVSSPQPPLVIRQTGTTIPKKKNKNKNMNMKNKNKKHFHHSSYNLYVGCDVCVL
jgi:hypothetical protein